MLTVTLLVYAVKPRLLGPRLLDIPAYWINSEVRVILPFPYQDILVY